MLSVVCLVCVSATQMGGEFLPSKLAADDSQHFNVGGCELLCLVSVGISAEQTARLLHCRGRLRRGCLQ